MKRFALLVFAAGFCSCLACEGEAKKQSVSKAKLLLYCGAGIQPPVAELVETFGRANDADINVDYAGSEVLLSSIKLDQRGDLYMPGDRHYVQLAAREGMILSSKSVCYFVPVILVQKDNPKKIAGLQDLIKPGAKLGLGDVQACAIGRTSRKIFDKNSIAWSDVEKNLTFQSLTVNELGVQIQVGSLDAVIVWDAVARYYAEHGEEVAIPLDQNVVSTVDVGILKFTQHQELAAKFVDFAASQRGRTIFKKHNYRVNAPGSGSK